MEIFGRKFLAWTIAFGATLSLLGFLVATGEPIRYAEIASQRPEAREPEAATSLALVDNMYRDPGLAAWRTP